MNKPNIILVGGGRHCKSCINVIEQENTKTNYWLNTTLLKNRVKRYVFLADRLVNIPSSVRINIAT